MVAKKLLIQKCPIFPTPKSTQEKSKLGKIIAKMNVTNAAKSIGSKRKQGHKLQNSETSLKYIKR